ncbi:MAG: efflux RND transporter periplasmic adaptor subunit [Rubricoccaceae bacterium]|nr:efflux RND transporter periplasmic adaptor subunit [Rubricoccaceae bacterium]
METVTAPPPRTPAAQDPAAPPPTTPKAGASPTKKILIALGVLVGLVVVAALVFGGDGGGEGVEVETAVASSRAVTQTVTASGQVRPEVEVAISSDVSGEIVFLGVEEGDVVERGQLLIRVQPDFYASQREQAEANVLQAQAGVEQARADRARAEVERRRARTEFERTEEIVARGAAPAAELDAARAALENAEATVATAAASERAAQFSVRAAQATLRQASQQLGKTSIYAPITGTVSQLNVELGERVVGTAQMAGTEILRIAELDRMQLEVDVNENDVVHVQLGDSARVEVDAYPDRPLSGVVTQIANSARVSGFGTTEQVTNFPVEIRILGADGDAGTGALVASAADEGGPTAAPPRLRPGMSGTVDVYTQTIRGAVVVPIQAVTIRDFNALAREARREARERGEEVDETPIPDEEDLRRVVFAVEDGEVVMREVETGIQDDTHIEITSGLAGGETVVSGPFRLLRTELDDGDPVQPRDPDAEPLDDED